MAYWIFFVIAIIVLLFILGPGPLLFWLGVGVLLEVGHCIISPAHRAKISEPKK